MQEYINPEHYKHPYFGTNGGLTFIYQNFLNDILAAEAGKIPHSFLSPLIAKANQLMLAYLKGNARKYDYRAGKKLYSERTSEESSAIDFGKRDFYENEYARILRIQKDREGGLSEPAYDIFPGFIAYDLLHIHGLNLYLSLLKEEKHYAHPATF